VKKAILGIFCVACLMMAGCQPAVITAVKWDSGVSGDKVQTRCEQLDMRDKSDMDNIFKKYDGWKLIYISEYTTGNRIGTQGAACFERVK